MKEAEDARSICVAVETLECSGELRQAIEQHAGQMVDTYRELNKLITDGVDNEQAYEQIFAKAAQLSTWYKSRRKVAMSMKAAASAGK